MADQLSRPQPVYPVYTFPNPFDSFSQNAWMFNYLAQSIQMPLTNFGLPAIDVDEHVDVLATQPEKASNTPTPPPPARERLLSPPAETSSSRCSSTDSAKIRRGRPQQNIEDQDDPQSQKKRHRRLYARKYRAQMRQKVDEVKTLNDELAALKKTLKAAERRAETFQLEVAQRDSILRNLFSQFSIHKE